MDVFAILSVSTPADFDSHKGLHTIDQLENAVREWWSLGKDKRQLAIDAEEAKRFRSASGESIMLNMRNKATVVFHKSGLVFVNFVWHSTYVYKPWMKTFDHKGFCNDFYILVTPNKH